MARQVLENGVILPAEYSDDWYDDMTSNLTKLDDVIGSDSEKLSSADVGAAALSNNYNDLDNLPTIPTVNDATLTIQKNGVDVETFTANASSNVTCNITVPTKTSDLTNDSNFVDTSNAAVSSGITSAKVTDYDSHIEDTDIHVTTTDKNRWNNQTYVFRYSSTALTASSTNSNTLLDNTDNLKVGDKVIDSSGVLFSITAIDTENSTFTIGTALVDLAKDSDVVHKSENETISGNKTFLDVPITFKSSTAELGVTGGNTKVIFTDKNLLNLAGITFGNYASSKLSYCRFHIYDKDSNNQEVENFIEFSYVNNNQVAYFRPNTSNFVTLGTVSNRWSKVYATNYYYGSNNVEFSTKFVTTDTAQTISENKTFSSDLFVANANTSANTPNLSLRNYKVDRGTTDTGVQTITFLDKNAKALTLIESRRTSNGNTGTNIFSYNTDDNNNTVSGGVTIIKGKTYTNFAPSTDNAVTCGRPLAKWSDVQTYKVNALEPSSLSLPSGNLNDIIDISSYLSILDGSSANTYVAPANGWISITLSNSSGIQAYINGLWGHQIVRPTAGGIRFLMPVLKSLTVNILIFGGTVDNARFIPCQGNV